MSARHALLARYVETHPDDVARQIERLPAAEVGPIFSAMGGAFAARLLPYLAPPTAARGLREIERTEATAMLSAVEPDVAVSLLRQTAAPLAEELIAALPPQHSTPLRALLAYPADSAGGVMDPLVLTAPLAATVADTRTLVARHPDHLYYYLYVVDTERRLAGVIDIAELLQADEATPIRSVARRASAWLPADLSLQAIFEHPGWHEYDALPVLDNDRRFLGVIRHRRMRQLMATHKPDVTSEPGVRTVMALGEIYWLGLCGLMQGIAATASEPVRQERP